MLRILITDRRSQTRRIVRLVGRSFLVGNSADCEVLLTGHDVAPRHCLLELTRRGLRVTAIDLTAETRANGRLMQRQVLQGGDILQIGHYDLELELDAEFHEPDAAPDREAVTALRADLRARRMRRARRRRIGFLLQALVVAGVVIGAFRWIQTRKRPAPSSPAAELAEPAIDPTLRPTAREVLSTTAADPEEDTPSKPASKPAIELAARSAAPGPGLARPADAAPASPPATPPVSATPTESIDDAEPPAARRAPPPAEPEISLVTLRHELESMAAEHLAADPEVRPAVARRLKALAGLYPQPVATQLEGCCEERGQRLRAEAVAEQLTGLLEKRRELDACRQQILDSLAAPESDPDADERLHRLLYSLWGRMQGGAPAPRLSLDPEVKDWVTEARSFAELLDGAGFPELARSPSLALLLAPPGDTTVVTVRNIAANLDDRRQLDLDREMYLENRHLPAVQVAGEAELLHLFNSHRAMLGLGRLRFDPDLYTVARHASQAADAFAEVEAAARVERSGDAAAATLVAAGPCKSAWVVYKDILADRPRAREILARAYSRAGMASSEDYWVLLLLGSTAAAQPGR